jgi:hypothetical protein
MSPLLEEQRRRKRSKALSTPLRGRNFERLGIF